MKVMNILFTSSHKHENKVEMKRKRIRNPKFLEVAEKVMRWEIKMAEEATPVDKYELYPQEWGTQNVNH